GAVDEAERLAAAVAVAERLERALALPALEHAMLEPDVVRLLGDGVERGHPRILFRGPRAAVPLRSARGSSEQPWPARCRDCDQSSSCLSQKSSNAACLAR